MSSPFRPMPDDFLTLAPGKSHNWLRAHYTTGDKCVTRWLKEAGIAVAEGRSSPKNKLPVPADFAAWAPKETSAELCLRYSVADGTVARWRREAGIPTPYMTGERRLKPIPADFADKVRELGRNQAMHHYGVSGDLMGRWLRESGLAVSRRAPIRFKRAAEKRLAVVCDNRDGSEASRAQSWLQRFYPVWRCDELGRFDPKGSHFRCDGITRTQDEMIERAVRKGWQRDDWRSLAA